MLSSLLFSLLVSPSDDDRETELTKSAGGMHILGEVFNGDPTYVCPYQVSSHSAYEVLRMLS
jgi:hypothetical protein